MNDTSKFGFRYTVDHIRDGLVIGSEQVDNLVPTEGITYLLGAAFKSTTQQANWFVGLFEGNYTPTAGVTAASVAATATECTAYAETTREAWTSGSISSGALSNAASKAEFTFNATKTIYGGFLVSSSTKGGVLGVLASIVRFSSPKNVESGDLLRITAGSTLISA